MLTLPPGYAIPEDLMDRGGYPFRNYIRARKNKKRDPTYPPPGRFLHNTPWAPVRGLKKNPL